MTGFQSLRRSTFAATLLLIQACSSAPKNSSEDSDDRGTPTRSSTRMVDHGELVVGGVKLENTQFDFPITINSRVEYWVDYFTGRGRKHFSRYLERSELFIPYIVPLLKQNGLPEDLVYLSMIESGFNNHARSSAKAVGPWQFMPATGKRYGLAVNWWVDERRDTRKSTLAAVEYLRDLYSIFNSWELAASSYNAGEAKVARAIRRYGTKDFWVLTRHRFLRPETRDYVPKIIAAALLAKNRHLFGFPASTIKPSDDEAISPSGELVKVVKESEPLASSGNTQTSLKALLSADDYNEYEDAPEDLGLDSPSSQAISVARQDGAAEVSNDPVAQARPVATPKVSKKGDLTGEYLSEFEVQGPADLLKIARAAGLSYATVKSLNPELLRWCTPPSKRMYRIKLPVSVKDKFLATYNHEAFPRRVEFLSYKVRPGETLAKIARRYGIKADGLTELNRVNPKAPLRVGGRISLPLPNDRSRTLASLEVIDPPEVRRRRARRVRRTSSRKHSSSYQVTTKRREAARSRHSRGRT
ncbi:MAG: transglycosylase SLT domain-containing protein [Bdellovibrionales bacterium]|nr:transglycosylase SLT domain-containing protein [Bdellovibrionales bacterium]